MLFRSVWNLPLNHPVNLAYEAATANLSDVNMIDPFHLQEYGKVAINYNRDVEAFPVLNNLLTKVIGECIYKSPTDMGVNMVGSCISDDEACREASNQEIIRRCYQAQVDYVHDKIDENVINKLENILTKSNISKDDRKVAVVANELAKKTGEPVTAIELVDGTIVTGKTSKLMGASSAVLLNAAKIAAGLPDIELFSPKIIEPIQELKTQYLNGNNPRLHTDEVLIALAIGSQTSYSCQRAMMGLSNLKYAEIHSTVILSEVDTNTFKKLGMNVTMNPIYQTKKLYHKGR